MTTMIRKQIYLKREQNRILRETAIETGLSEAELIRRAIDQGLRQMPRRHRHDIWEEELKFIDNLIALGPVAGTRTWMRDDLHER